MKKEKIKKIILHTLFLVSLLAPVILTLTLFICTKDLVFLYSAIAFLCAFVPLLFTYIANVTFKEEKLNKLN